MLSHNSEQEKDLSGGMPLIVSKDKLVVLGLMISSLVVWGSACDSQHPSDAFEGRIAEVELFQSPREIDYPPLGIQPNGNEYIDSKSWEEYFFAICGGEGELWDYSHRELEEVYRGIASGDLDGEPFPHFRDDVIRLSKSGVSADQFILDVEELMERPEGLVTPKDSVRAYVNAIGASLEEHIGPAIEVCRDVRFDFSRRTTRPTLDQEGEVVPGGIEFPIGPSLKLMVVLSGAMKVNCLNGDPERALVILKAAHGHITAYKKSYSLLGAIYYAQVAGYWLRMMEEWSYCFGSDADLSTKQWIRDSLQGLALTEELESAFIGERARALELHRFMEERALSSESSSLDVGPTFFRDRRAMLNCIDNCLRRIRTRTGFGSRDGSDFSVTITETVSELEPLGEVILGSLPYLLREYADLSDYSRLAEAGIRIQDVAWKRTMEEDATYETLFPGGRLTLSGVSDEAGVCELQILPSLPDHDSQYCSESWSLSRNYCQER